MLWIAFIFQYLWDTKQQLKQSKHYYQCCELLSFFSIFGIQNNVMAKVMKTETVVNCFHFSVSLGYKTTKFHYLRRKPLLWIAFIFQYLWDTKQQDFPEAFNAFCCELLSFFSIFGIQNNFLTFVAQWVLVVNCFHFSVSLGYKTTFSLLKWKPKQLWIAFIFQYLWDTKQPARQISSSIIGCELLSFFSIFGIQNNEFVKDWRKEVVVNCFHFSVSLGYKTTRYLIF